ncbi:hypothetical protein K457DRAFT_1454725 [Linnemannia elongata AG-77]|uniref:Uncharacterized protein n=1 Tax=Linnemannia elongata AG-77 TaxID=1314771 RepID=A0A197JS77_9FUNG|nr:hypothetical protein K457DRAFT_1454725 [Linnemannia elongata AG-77]
METDGGHMLLICKIEAIQNHQLDKAMVYSESHLFFHSIPNRPSPLPLLSAFLLLSPNALRDAGKFISVPTIKENKRQYQTANGKTGHNCTDQRFFAAQSIHSLTATMP